MTHHAGHHNQEMQQCIRDCLDCAQVCTETIAHCLTLGGPHAAPEHIGLMQSCSELCNVSASAMMRHTEGHQAICGACAEICRRCADSCAQLGTDEGMTRCVEACRRCAESCQKMAA